MYTVNGLYCVQSRAGPVGVYTDIYYTVQYVYITDPGRLYPLVCFYTTVSYSTREAVGMAILPRKATTAVSLASCLYPYSMIWLFICATSHCTYHRCECVLQ